jgi:ribonucleoside-diphosphate reductase subunit M1
MWNVKPSALMDWTTLKARIAKHGVRNSLLVAPMPTASTSVIMGVNECFEPYTSNIYSRRVNSGDFQMVNPHMMRHLIKLGVWTPQLRNDIIKNSGSVQQRKFSVFFCRVFRLENVQLTIRFCD